MYINPEIKFVSASKKKVDFFCPICNYPYSSYEDFSKRSEWNCCNSCYINFAEARKEEWKNGWRPDKKSISEYIKIKKQLNSSIITIKEK